MVLSARLYSQALRQIEHEADFAYQSLISCVETIANAALHDYRPEKTEMVQTKKALFDMATQMELPREKAEELVVKACSDNPWSGRKFVKFLVDYPGEDIWKKDDLFRIPESFFPKKEDLESTLKSIYGVRSGATHQGRPYPRSIAIGMGPTISFEALREIDWGSSNSTQIPPVVWFERLVNLAVNNFIKSLGGSAPEENGESWY